MRPENNLVFLAKIGELIGGGLKAMLFGCVPGIIVSLILLGMCTFKNKFHCCPVWAGRGVFTGVVLIYAFCAYALVKGCKEK